MSIDERELTPEGKAIIDASRESIVKSWAKGIVGGVLGGAVGWFVCSWLHQQGFYALALPGAAIGLGFAAMSRRSMVSGGVACAIAALAVGFVWEGLNRPFVADDSLSYFMSNLGDLQPMTFILIGLGAVLGFWFGRGR